MFRNLSPSRENKGSSWKSNELKPKCLIQNGQPIHSKSYRYPCTSRGVQGYELVSTSEEVGSPLGELRSLSRGGGLGRFATQTSTSTHTLPRKPNCWLASSDFFGEKIRTRSGPIRTASLLPFQIKIPFHETPPAHQILAPKIKQMKALGMTNQKIANSMKISRKTVKKGLNEQNYLTQKYAEFSGHAFSS